jgi:hypothetical protein
VNEKPSESVATSSVKPQKRILLTYLDGVWKAECDPTCESMLTRRDVTVLLPRVLIVKQRQMAREHYLKMTATKSPPVTSAVGKV